MGDHDAQVDDLEVVALEDDADDVLADVVDVPLDRGGDDPALGPGLARARLLRLQEGDQVGDRLLHDAGALDHLGEEHPARPEQVADPVHAGHQRPLDHVQGPVGLAAGFLRVRDHVVGDAPDQGVAEALGHRALAPGEVGGRLLPAPAPGPLGDLQQPFGGVLATGQDRVLHPFAQVFGDFRVDRQLAGVDDAHVHARPDGVVEEDRVHGLPHRVVAPEGEGHVADAAADQGVGQGLLDRAGGGDVIAGVAVVGGDPRGHGEDVGVEDDVLGRKPHRLGQDAVGAGGDVDHAPIPVRLAGLVEGHDHHGGTEAQDLPGPCR